MRRVCLGLAIFLVLALSINGAVAVSYNSSVFNPNGVRYHIDIKYGNATFGPSGECIVNKSIEGDIMIISRELSIDYIGWGFDVDVKFTERENGEITNEEKYQLSIPPILLAAKVNTRQLHPTDILIKLAKMQDSEVDIQKLLSDVYSAKPVEDIYIYNPFYIGSKQSIGDEVKFGLINKTAGDEYVAKVKITREKDLSLDFGEVKTVVIDISLDELEISGVEDFEIPEEVEARVNLYYEKETGWLVKIEVEGRRDVVDEERGVEIHERIEGEIVLKDPGTIPLVPGDYLSRLLGLPPYTLVVGSISLALAVIYFKILRRGAG